MNYKISVKNWGRVFSVPCSVVDKYLKDADGESLKVLLCVISFGEDEISSDNIAKLCGISESCVRNALDFWTKCGIINAVCDDFVGFTPIAAENNAISEGIITKYNAQTQRNSNSYYSPAQIAEIINTSEDLKAFFYEVQSILGRILTNADQRAFIYIYEEYGFSPASILLLTEYCKSLGVTTPAYFKSVAENWFRQDIIAYDDVEKHIIMLNDYHSYENEIKRKLDIHRKLTEKQSAFVNVWKKKAISPELIELAYDIAVDRGIERNIFNYINGIIMRWSENGITTVEQAKSEKIDVKKKVSSKKEYTYDLDEIEEFQKNFLLNRKKAKN